MDDSALTLELDEVELRRGGHLLVSGLSFTLQAGQLALLTGPNGSGKTTLLRALTGLARPERGSIRLNGRAIAGLEPEQRRLVAYQAHLEGLKRDLTINENIRFISRLNNNSNNYSEVLSELGLTGREGLYVGQLSAGQKRRVALAALQVRQARVWLLDEPLTNLDRPGRDLVSNLLNRHLATGGMAVVATHLADALARPGSLLVEL